MAAEFHLTLIRSDDRDVVASSLRDALEALGFVPYDPFPGGFGSGILKPVREVRAFVEPARDGWVRVPGVLVPEALARVSVGMGTILHVWLGTPPMWGYLVFSDGETTTDPAALRPFLLPGKGLDDVERVLIGDLPESVQGPSDEVERLAERYGVDARKAAGMIGRLQRDIFSKIGASDDEVRRAEDALRADLWRGNGGIRLKALMACLDVPAGWRWPDFDAIRAAYIVARTRERDPDATPMPGDEEALAAVPDALDYVPIYYHLAP